MANDDSPPVPLPPAGVPPIEPPPSVPAPPVEPVPVQPPPPPSIPDAARPDPYARPADPYAAPPAPQPVGYAQPTGYAAPSAGHPQQPLAYAPAAYAPVPAAPAQGLSIASMVCGIGGLLLLLVGFGFLPALAAVITGHLAVKRQPAARPLWLTGIITGYVGLGISLIIGIFIVLTIVIGFAASGGSFG